MFIHNFFSVVTVITIHNFIQIAKLPKFTLETGLGPIWRFSLICRNGQRLFSSQSRPWPSYHCYSLGSVVTTTGIAQLKQEKKDNDHWKRKVCYEKGIIKCISFDAFWLKKRWQQLWAIDIGILSIVKKSSLLSQCNISWTFLSNSSILTFICRSLDNIDWIGIICSKTSPAPIDMAREQSLIPAATLKCTLIYLMPWLKQMSTEGRAVKIPKACMTWFVLSRLCSVLLLALTVSDMKECWNDFTFLLRNEQKRSQFWTNKNLV